MTSKHCNHLFRIEHMRPWITMIRRSFRLSKAPSIFLNGSRYFCVTFTKRFLNNFACFEYEWYVDFRRTFWQNFNTFSDVIIPGCKSNKINKNLLKCKRNNESNADFTGCFDLLSKDGWVTIASSSTLSGENN